MAKGGRERKELLKGRWKEKESIGNWKEGDKKVLKGQNKKKIC